MDRDRLVTVLRALVESGSRFLVVGGVAVVAHGYVRLTEDLDLVLRLRDREEVLRALEALASLGYRPLVPVPLERFADPSARKSWIATKDARVFQLYSDDHPGLTVDLFLEEPFEFDRVAARSPTVAVGSVDVPIIGLDDLIRMKRSAARPKDLDDATNLEAIRSWIESNEEEG